MLKKVIYVFASHLIFDAFGKNTENKKRQGRLGTYTKE